jgi:DNA-binding response OmpR family regulator
LTPSVRAEARDAAPRYNFRVAEARPKRILVVDDDEGIRDELVATLAEDRRLEVSGVNDGWVALHRIATGELWPDLILLDLMMPRLDGDGFLSALRAISHTGNIAVIVMTALPEDSVPEAVRGHARSILFKPFTLANLTAAVDAVLAQ